MELTTVPTTEPSAPETPDPEALVARYRALASKHNDLRIEFNNLTAKRNEVWAESDEIAEEMVAMAGPLLDAGYPVRLPVKMY